MSGTGPRDADSSAGAIMKLNRRRFSWHRSARMNLPNSITMSRIAMIPLLLWILSPHFPWRGSSGEQEIAASVLFGIALTVLILRSILRPLGVLVTAVRRISSGDVAAEPPAPTDAP